MLVPPAKRLARGLVYFKGAHNALPVVGMYAGGVVRINAGQFGMHGLRPGLFKASRKGSGESRGHRGDVGSAVQQGLEVKPCAANQQRNFAP